MKKRFFSLIAIVLLSASIFSSVRAIAGTSDYDYVSVEYQTHCQSYGWKPWVKNGEVSGTTGEAKRVESLRITTNSTEDVSVIYAGYVEGEGWTPWHSEGESCGTTGQYKKLEAIKVKLTGKDASKYEIYYCTHVQSYGWTSWTSDGLASGSLGLGKRMEALKILVLEKGAKAPENTGDTNESLILAENIFVAGEEVDLYSNEVFPNVSYNTHCQTYGWLPWVYCGEMSGTSGEAKRLEAIQIKLSNKDVSGSITYRTHCQTYGWLPWVEDGALSGTTGQAKRLEAIQIKLTGELAEKYEVYYRVHCQTYGWMPWVKNGEIAGTTGQYKRLEAIQVQIVPKNTTWYDLVGTNISERLVFCDVILKMKNAHNGTVDIEVLEIDDMQVAVEIPSDMSATRIIAVAKKINLITDKYGNLIEIRTSEDGVRIE